MIDRESDYKTRAIKEAIHIRVNREVMNSDEGARQLSRAEKMEENDFDTEYVEYCRQKSVTKSSSSIFSCDCI